MEIPREIFQHITSFTPDYCDIGRLSMVCTTSKNLVDYKLSIVQKEEIEALYENAIILGWYLWLRDIVKNVVLISRNQY